MVDLRTARERETELRSSLSYTAKPHLETKPVGTGSGRGWGRGSVVASWHLPNLLTGTEPWATPQHPHPKVDLGAWA